MQRLSLILLFIIPYALFCQSSFTKSLTSYRANYLPEKVFVHTDKNIYAAGETIWMAAYLADGQTHRLGAFSVFTKVDLLDVERKVIQHLKLFMPKGHASGSIVLPADIAAGQYQLIAYTNYQQNSGKETIFRKNIRIVKGINPTENTSSAIENDLDIVSSSVLPTLKFFPEGGDCVEGLPCRIALAAADEQGNPLSLDGFIQSSDTQPIAFFKTNEYGMGSVSFTPQKGMEYTAKVKTSKEERSFPIPTILSEGYTLNVRSQNNTIQLVLASNTNQGLKDAKIVVHHRGLPFIEEALDTDEPLTIINIPPNDLVAGVHVATLFDKQNQPVAERLFFVAPKENSTAIDINTAHTTYRLRQNMEIQLDVPTNNIEIDSLAEAQLSISVVPEASSAGLTQDDIRTWFLLNSDIDVPIPDAAAILFDNAAAARDYLIDQFLMTRAWRRFRWKRLLEERDFDPAYTLERGIYLKGKMTKKESPDQARSGKVFLTQIQDNLFEDTMTDEEGNFTFGPYLLFDTTNFILQGRYKTGKKNQVSSKISLKDNPNVLLALQQNDIPPTLPFPPKQILKDESVSDYEDLSRKTLITARNYDSLTVELDAFSVTADRITQAEKERQARPLLYGTPSFRMVLDEVQGATNLNRIEDLLFRLRGVQIIGGQPVIRGAGSFQGTSTPLFIVNGMEVDFSYITSTFTPRDIEFVDVLTGPDATIYGSRGGNGVILFYTRKGIGIQNAPLSGIVNVEAYGFHKAREFANFDPNQPGNQNRPDLRTTLHWNPSLRSDASGKAKESFTTSDQLGKFLIIVQGIRGDGQVLFGSSSFEVKGN